MYKILPVAVLLFLLACSNEPKNTPAVSAQTDSSEQTAASNTDNAAAEKQPEVEELKLGPGLNLWIADAEVDAGAAFCLDVTMSEVKGLISMQYSVRWDPKVLEFQSVKGFTLPFMDENDFGRHKITEGILTAVWIEDNLQGVDTQTGDILYQLCFKAVGNSGTETPVRFWSSPTPFEVVVLPERIIPLTSHKGNVTIR